MKHIILSITALFCLAWGQTAQAVPAKEGKDQPKEEKFQPKEGKDQPKEEKFLLKGKVYDFKTRTELPGATVTLMRTDSTVVEAKRAISEWQDGEEFGQSSDFHFAIPKQEATSYIIRCSLPGYETAEVTIALNNLKKREFMRELPPFLMREEREKTMEELTVSSTKVQFYYRGDTVVYNADAFMLAEGSMLDALIRQLPGVEIKSNGDIYHNGKLIKNLMLNGKDFFRNNRRIMLDNLPTYMVKQIEVYDKLGKLSEFVGHEMPNDKEYVMDVKLKKEYSVGWIANAEAGAGLAERSYTGDNPYLARLFALRFTDHSRLSAYANANNLSDERKPGQSDGWTPRNLSTGTLTQQSGGLDYNIDARNKKWELTGDATFSRKLLHNAQTTDRTNFLATGDTYERIVNSSHDKNLQLGTNHRLEYNFEQMRLDVRYSLTYNRFDRTSGMEKDARGDTLLNRYYTQGLTRGHHLWTGLSALSVVKFKGNTVDNLDAGVRIQYGNRKDDTFNRYDLYMGSAAAPTQHADQYYRNHPDHDYTLEAHASYHRKLSNGLFLITRYGVEHSEARRDSRLYRLDLLADYEQGDMGILPSAAEYEAVQDWRNSYESRRAGTSHTLAPSLEFYHANDKGQLNGRVHIPLTARHDRLDYLRGSLDTAIVRNTLLASVNNTYAEWKSKDNRHDIGLWYTLNAQTPDLLYLADIHDDTDPLNIREGNTGLKNSYRHQWRTIYQKQKKTGDPRDGAHALQLDINLTHNAIAMGQRYDTATGVRTSRACNVNGNWDIAGGYYFVHALDKKKKLSLITGVTGTHRQNVDLVGTDTDVMARSIVRTEAVKPEAELRYRIGKHGIRGKFTGQWQHISSRRADFTDLNIRNCQYVLNSAFQLTANLQLSTDLTLFSRRGFHDASLNTNDLVWNARLSYTLLKGNLVLMLDGFDILGQLSNVTYQLNGQGRTEIRRNVLPQYGLFHVQYRLNRQPKTNNNNRKS